MAKARGKQALSVANPSTSSGQVVFPPANSAQPAPDREEKSIRRFSIGCAELFYSPSLGGRETDSLRFLSSYH